MWLRNLGEGLAAWACGASRVFPAWGPRGRLGWGVVGGRLPGAGGGGWGLVSVSVFRACFYLRVWGCALVGYAGGDCCAFL